MISCIIPAFDAPDFLLQAVSSVVKSAERCAQPVELIIVHVGKTGKTEKAVSHLNLPIQLISVTCPYPGYATPKNFGANLAVGDILVFLDDDCIIEENFFSEVVEKSSNPTYVGGGVRYVKLTRYSIPILIFLSFWMLYAKLHHITIGAFWVRKNIFKEIGGFLEYTQFNDIEFALRLRFYALKNKMETKALRKTSLLWSTRRFDKEGDWVWLKVYNPLKLF